MNDDLISAYLDGELDAEKRSLAEEVLRHDGSAGARMARMKAGDDLLRRAFPRMATAADDPVAAMILEDRPRAVRAPVVRTWGLRAAALAAACVLGVLVGRFGPFAPSNEVAVFGPQLRVSAAAAHLLDTLPSGAAAPVMGGEMQIALSVETADGGFCRQFRATSGAAVSDALACKQDGRWNVIAQAAVREEPADTYRTASAGVSPVDAAVESLGGVTLLSDTEEREQIARGWK